jgi:general secretion pathway protein D
MDVIMTMFIYKMTKKRHIFFDLFRWAGRWSLQLSLTIFCLVGLFSLLAFAATTDRLGRPLNHRALQHARNSVRGDVRTRLQKHYEELHGTKMKQAQKPVATKPSTQLVPVNSPTKAPIEVAKAPTPTPTKPPIQLAQLPRRRPRRGLRPVITPQKATPTVQPTPVAKAAKKPADPNALVNLDFRDTDIKSIIKFLSEQTGTNYLYDETIKGKLTLVGPKKVTLKEAVWLLETLLEFKGYTVVGVGDFKKVIPLAKAQGDTIETRIDYKESDEPELAQDREVTQLLRLKYTNATDIKAAISGLMARPNALITYAPTNTLIVTENALNIKRLVRIIKELDTPVQGKRVYLIPLKNSLAKQIQAQINELLKNKVEEKLEPQTRQVAIGKPVVAADERTNTLIVVCLEKDYSGIRELIRRLDRDVRLAPEMKVIPVLYADAEGIVAMLEKMLKVGGDAASQSIATAADKRTNAIILSSISKHLLQRAESIIKQLDREIVPEQDIMVQVYHLEFAEAEKMAELLKGFEFVPVVEQQAAKPGAQKQKEDKVGIIADKATNSLIITCPKTRWPYILDVITQLDVVRPQVMVEVLIAEIDVSRARELGLDFNVLDSDEDGNRPFALGNTDGIESLFSGGAVANGLNVGILTGNTFDVGAAAGGDAGELSKIALLIRALENDTRANILSTPTLLTSDNETAKISVGEQIQLPASFNTASNTGLNTITNFSTEDLGIILEITPRITKNDHVLLKLNQVIKSRTNDTLFDQNIPVISKREVDTNVTVKNLTTIAIGGLISETENEVETKIPLLSKIPGLGKLFRNKRTDVRKTNLMIFLTPHIIRTAEDADRVTGLQRKSVKAAVDDETKTERYIHQKLFGLAVRQNESQELPKFQPAPSNVAVKATVPKEVPKKSRSERLEALLKKYKINRGL